MVRALFFFVLLIYLNLHLKANGVNLATDRSLYIAGENVVFAAALADSASAVLYTELISPSGLSISRGKFRINHNKATGSLHIPDETITGYYFVRAYTRFMRNSGPVSYAYIMLKIVNPYKIEVSRGDETLNDSLHNYIADISADNSSAYELSHAKDIYYAGEKVTLKITSINSPVQQEILSVSVVPQSTFHQYNNLLPQITDTVSDEYFCRETGSIALSGLVIDSETGYPMPDYDVNCSVMGYGQDFITTRSDEQGRFFIELPPLTGERDIYISPSVLSDKAQVLVDNDFCNRGIVLAVPVFSLSEDEKEIVMRLAANARISGAYSEHITPIASDTIDNSPFYGNPEQVLILDRYIRLPTLEEYFNELPGFAKVRNSENGKIIRLLGHNGVASIYPPLVLIDQVAVGEHERVLAAPPVNVDRIEVINKPYLKGEKLYGGIVSIISKNGDFAAIDLPASGTFINYKFFSPSNNAVEYITEESPDARNTVFFKGNITSDHITFTAPPTPGTYNIILTAIDSSGKRMVFGTSFRVAQHYD